MDFKTAKRILSDMSLGQMSEHALESGVGGEYFSVYSGKDEAVLDGRFTAEQLEAIAAWMRNPQACIDA